MHSYAEFAEKQVPNETLKPTNIPSLEVQVPFSTQGFIYCGD